MNTKTVSILGTPYEVTPGVPYDSDPELEGRSGYCSPFDKRIVVADQATVPVWKDMPEKAQTAMVKSSIRHELVHAFFFESGLWGNSHNVEQWACDEEMTGWIALQFPKILAVCKELECESDG